MCLPKRTRSVVPRSLTSLSSLTALLSQSIGLFLLSLLPLNAKTPSRLNPTPEVLLQAIDSLIDLYSDEDSPYDAPVFRAKGFLGRLENAVGGVRAAVRLANFVKSARERG